MAKNPQYKILRSGANSAPVFVGDLEVAERCLEALRFTFFFAAGSAKPRSDEFPFSLELA